MQELADKSHGKVLTDMFANTDINQARALSEILNEFDYYTNDNKIKSDKGEYRFKYQPQEDQILSSIKRDEVEESKIEEPTKIDDNKYATEKQSLKDEFKDTGLYSDEEVKKVEDIIDNTPVNSTEDINELTKRICNWFNVGGKFTIT
jgi:hypothetical protein